MRPCFSSPEIRKPNQDNLTVMVTGVGMAKGLLIARSFWLKGYKVIGADFESDGTWVIGRFSHAIAKFYSLKHPTEFGGNTNSYTEQLLDIIEQERVALWISCSGVSSAEEDGMAKDEIEKRSSCHAVQFSGDQVKTLHRKDSFSQLALEIGLAGPKATTVTTVEEAMEFLNHTPTSAKYLAKSVILNDLSRTSQILLPLTTREDTKSYLDTLEISSSHPWLLQQYVNGTEFMTHSFVQNGELKAFIACESKDVLMHYRPMPVDDPLFQSMLKYTSVFLSRLSYSTTFTGHLGFDFLVEQSWDETGSKAKLYPIECNPRVQTNVLLFEDEMHLVDLYLSTLGNAPTKRLERAVDIYSQPSKTGYYWIGHDLVTLCFVPFVNVLLRKLSVLEFLYGLREFLEHVLFWKDGTFCIYDPFPWWWLYHGYWPSIFLRSILRRSAWSQVNVSTGKVFDC
ncbi:hypothetical protein IFR05_002486 [Cadophora sp. M221]|nr:hypothetical protein IFR05_002486 [Cadophora sp. M221]